MLVEYSELVNNRQINRHHRDVYQDRNGNAVRRNHQQRSGGLPDGRT